MGMNYTNETFAVVRAFAMMFEAFVLTVTLWKLKRAKVSRTDSGHLNIADASILLALQLLMVATGLFAAFYFTIEKSTGKKAINMAKDIIDFLLGVMYFKMIQHFVTSFKLQT